MELKIFIFTDRLLRITRPEPVLIGGDVSSRPPLPDSLPRRLRFWVAMFFGVLLALSAPAAELAVGDAIPAFAAKDQFGKDFKFGPGLRFLLLGFDMGASKEANRKLAELGTGWLEKTNAAFVLDIHTMPAVARFFALPKMRKYPQRIVLGEDETMLAPFPRKPEKLTVLVLTSAGKLQEIRYWDPAAEEIGSVLK